MSHYKEMVLMYAALMFIASITMIILFAIANYKITFFELMTIIFVFMLFPSMEW